MHHNNLNTLASLVLSALLLPDLVNSLHMAYAQQTLLDDLEKMRGFATVPKPQDIYTWVQWEMARTHVAIIEFWLQVQKQFRTTAPIEDAENFLGFAKQWVRTVARAASSNRRGDPISPPQPSARYQHQPRSAYCTTHPPPCLPRLPRVCLHWHRALVRQQG